MLYEIKNDKIMLQVDTFGAEIHSLKLGSLEYIWQCGDAWMRYAPILFPFISSPKDRKYLVNGKAFRMNANHGFARDMDFKIIRKNMDILLFELSSNEETKAQYPFDFILQVSYRLIGNAVDINYIVNNIGNTSMYFYLGGHPAFNCPIDEGEFSDYEIVYDRIENLMYQNGEPLQNVSEGRIVSLTRSLFDNDAIILDHPNSKAITLRSKKSTHSVTVKYPESNAIAVWSPTGDDQATFVCLEPWTSVPIDYDDAEIELCKKEHAIKLNSGQKFYYNYQIVIE